MSDPGKAVFLSYASQDAEAAKRICDALRAAGVEVWFDAEGGLETGDEWDAKIRRQIKECVLFIPVISANTEARHEGYFRIEWELAAQRALGIASGVPFILPVVIDGTLQPDALVPDRFRSVQWTKVPGGAMSAEVLQRFQKLWSHRLGVARGVVPATVAPAGPAVQPGRRWGRWVALAAALVVLGAGGYAAFRAYYKRQEAAVLAALNMTPNEPVRKEGRVLVARLENRTGDPALERVGQLVADHVRRRAPELEWVESAAAIPEAKRLKPEATPADMLALAAEAGGDLLVTGDYYAEGEKLFITGRIFDLKRGRVLAELAPRPGVPAAVAAVVEDTAERLLGAAASVPRARSGREDLTKFVNFSVPRRFDAMQLIDRGPEGDPGRYRRSYERDPEGSLSSLVLLAVRHVFDGRYAEAEAVLAEVETASGRAPLVPYIRETMHWVRATAGGDADGVEQAVETICSWTPSNRLWRAERIYALYRANKPRAILKEFEAITPGSAGERLNLVWYARVVAYFLLQDFPNMEAAGRRALALSPKSDQAMQWVACGAALNRNYAETRRMFDAYDGVKERSEAMFNLFVAVLAVMRRSGQGETPEFAEFVRRADEWFASRSPRDAAASETRFAHAELHYMAGRYAEARQAAETMLRESPDDVRVRAFAAAAAIRLGDRAAGEKTIEWLRTVDPKYRFGYPAFAQAKLAALLGQPDTALRLLREAFAQHSAAVLDFSWEGLMMSPDFDSLRDDPRFKEFVAPRG